MEEVFDVIVARNEQNWLLKVVSIFIFIVSQVLVVIMQNVFILAMEENGFLVVRVYYFLVDSNENLRIVRV